jgi:hypothetical protein
VASCAVLSCAGAEEFGVLVGQTDAEGQDTYAWQMEYRQPLLPYFDASFSYLNEGHLFHHQRDGGMVQLWALTPRWRDRFAFALGAGPYFYFDTQYVARPPWYRNYHAIGEIYTGSLTYSVTQNWFVRLNLSEVHAPGDVDTRLVLLGAGYRLDGLFERVGAPGAPGGSGDADTSPPINQLGLLAGQTSDNNYYTSYFNKTSLTFGAEYRRAMTSHIELSAAWLNEDDGIDGRHNGVLGEIWLVERFSRRFSLGLGAGPYYALQPFRGDDGMHAARLAGIVSMTAGWQLTHSLIARISWHRAFTHDDQDRDIIAAGLAWSWGR